MASSEGEGKPPLASLHVEFVPLGSRKPDRARDTQAEPGRTLRDIIATIVADSYDLGIGKARESFLQYHVYINRPRNTPFFPIAATPRQIDAFNRSLAHPRHARIPDAMLDSSMANVLENYKIAAFTVYETSSPL
jgi:hypothetical protein